MRITGKTVDKVTHLAKLDFDPEAREVLVGHLGEIVSYMEKLNELETEGVEPTYHVLDLRNMMRHDMVGESLTQDEVLMNAPHPKNGYFSVPKVITEK